MPPCSHPAPQTSSRGVDEVPALCTLTARLGRWGCAELKHGHRAAGLEQLPAHRLTPRLPVGHGGTCPAASSGLWRVRKRPSRRKPRVGAKELRARHGGGHSGHGAGPQGGVREQHPPHGTRATARPPHPGRIRHLVVVAVGDGVGHDAGPPHLQHDSHRQHGLPVVGAQLHQHPVTHLGREARRMRVPPSPPPPIPVPAGTFLQPPHVPQTPPVPRGAQGLRPSC